MKTKNIPCVKYVCAGADCLGGKKEVTMEKCQHCKNYRPRKTGNYKLETIKEKKGKFERKEAAKQIRGQE